MKLPYTKKTTKRYIFVLRMQKEEFKFVPVYTSYKNIVVGKTTDVSYTD